VFSFLLSALLLDAPARRHTPYWASLLIWGFAARVQVCSRRFLGAS
jgi:hypothetical protein